MARPAFIIGPKLPRLARLLGVHVAEALGLCEFLWQAQYAKATEVVGDTIDAEINARWEGEPGRFVAAMLDDGVRLLDQDEVGILSVHDFWEHAPDYVKERRKTDLRRRALGLTLSDVRAASGRRGAAVTNARRGKPPANAGAVADATTANRAALAATPVGGVEEFGKPAANRRPPLPSPSLPSEEGASTKLLPAPDGDGVEELPQKTPRRAPRTGTIGAFCRAWEARYPELAPACPTADDCKAVNMALKLFPQGERERIAEAYVADNEPWLVTAAHRLGLLPKRLDAIRLRLASGGRSALSRGTLVGAHPPSKEGPLSPPRTFPPAPEGGGAWAAILERLRDVVDERDFDTWFRSTRQSGEVDGTLRVVVASELFPEYVGSEYGDLLRDVAAEHGVDVPIEFVVGI